MNVSRLDRVLRDTGFWTELAHDEMRAAIEAPPLEFDTVPQAE